MSDLYSLVARVDRFREPTTPDHVVIESGASLKPQPVDWIWKGWLAAGKLHILAGAPGQGKTTIGIGIAATVSKGGKWPDGTRCERGSVVIWSGEDDAADTLLPRLIGAGGDPARVHFITGAQVNSQRLPFDPARDLGMLIAAVEKIGDVKLLMVDPVVSAVAGDSHKNSEVRRGLQPLVDLAAAIGAALLGITHFSKGTANRDPTERVTGSVAFGAVARVVMVAAKTKGDDGEERRIFARSKSNIGPDDGGFVYSLDQVEALPGIEASRVLWGEPIEGTARDLLAEPEDDKGDSGRPRESAADFLRQVLGSDVVPVKTIEAEAKAAGISWATVRRAADDLLVVKRKGTGDKHASWYWSLPSKDKVLTPGAQGVHSVEVGKLSKLSTLPPQDAQDAQDAHVFGVNNLTPEVSKLTLEDDSDDQDDDDEAVF